MSRDDITMEAQDAISDTINQHDQMLKRLWCIAYEAGQKAVASLQRQLNKEEA